MRTLYTQHTQKTVKNIVEQYSMLIKCNSHEKIPFFVYLYSVYDMKNVSMAQRYAMKIALPDIMLVYQYIFLLFEI